MNAQPLFKQGKSLANVLALLERVQHADLTNPDIDEDNMGPSWGHYQFTVGGLNMSSSITSWQGVGSIATAFKTSSCCPQEVLGCTGDVFECWIAKYGWFHQ